MAHSQQNIEFNTSSVLPPSYEEIMGQVNSLKNNNISSDNELAVPTGRVRCSDSLVRQPSSDLPPSYEEATAQVKPLKKNNISSNNELAVPRGRVLRSNPVDSRPSNAATRPPSKAVTRQPFAECCRYVGPRTSSRCSKETEKETCSL